MKNAALRGNGCSNHTNTVGTALKEKINLLGRQNSPSRLCGERAANSLLS